MSNSPEIDKISFFKRNEKVLVITFGIMLLAVLIGRMAIFYIKSFNCPTDLRIYLNSTRCILNHIAPYSDSVYLTFASAPPLQPPSTMFFVMPLLPLPLSVSLVALTLTYVILIKSTKTFDGSSLFSPTYKNAVVWLTTVLGLQSSPVLSVLRPGQVTLIVLLLMTLVLYNTYSEKINVFLLGVAAAFKFSLLTIFVPVFIMQKRFLMGIGGFVVFAVLILAPGLFLDGIIPAITDYITLVLDDVTTGVNSYAYGSRISIITFDLFRITILNTIGKAIFLVLAVIAFYRTYKTMPQKKKWLFCPQPLPLAELGVAMTLTLLITYHRSYDCAIFIPALSLLCAQQFLHREYKLFVISFLALLFWCAPLSIVYDISAKIGGFFPNAENIVYYSEYSVQQLTHIFPLQNVALAGTFLWFVFVSLISHFKQNDHSV